MTVVDERLWHGDQSLQGSLIVRSQAGITYRARIRRDSYDNQCEACVETWMPDRGWREVQHIPIQHLPIRQFSYVQPLDRWQATMQESLWALVRLGVVVVEAGMPGHGKARTR